MHINKNIIVTAVCVLCSFAPMSTPVFAQEKTATNSVAHTEQQVTTTSTQTHTVPTQKTLSLAKQKRITNLAANISNRYDALVVRLQTITTRLESRMRKMDKQGLDTSEAEVSIADAKLSLEKTKNELLGIDSKVQQLATSEKPQETWISVQQLYATMYQDLVDTKKYLSYTVADIRRATEKPSQSAVTATTSEKSAASSNATSH